MSRKRGKMKFVRHFCKASQTLAKSNPIDLPNILLQA
jgi:hypothetical protein